MAENSAEDGSRRTGGAASPDDPPLSPVPHFRSADGVANIETLKRRKRSIVRRVPLPRDTLSELNRFFKLRIMQRDPHLALERLWTWSRTTAWRRVKEMMAAAGIFGAPAMPRDLRHSFGVNAFQSNVPPHLVERWLGHASLRTTSIYGDVVGSEERSIAERMWRS
jgi:integrase/recombinase XerD